jgi:TPR repeat protein
MIRRIKIVITRIKAKLYEEKGDYLLAIKSMEEAANLGCAKTQNELGAILLSGEMIESDPSKAMSWFKKAADQGFMYAQANVAWGYYSGKGLTQSYPLAISWYTKAAEQGHHESQYNLVPLENRCMEKHLNS